MHELKHGMRRSGRREEKGARTWRRHRHRRRRPNIRNRGNGRSPRREFNAKR